MVGRPRAGAECDCARDNPIEDIPLPDPRASLETRWLDPHYYVQARLAEMARTFYGGTGFPHLYSLIGGAGSTGLFLGAKERLAEETLWNGLHSGAVQGRTLSWR